MSLRVLAFGLLAIAALAAGSPAAGKGPVAATLTTNIPLDAEPGRQLRVAWRLVADVDGQQRPFNASGVFVRLVSPSGATSAEGFASGGAHTTGEYEAIVAVPQGGIGNVVIGLQGWISRPSGTQRSDVLFPITNDPIRSPPASEAQSSGGGSSLVTVAAVGAALVLALALGAGFVRRRQPRTTLTSQP